MPEEQPRVLQLEEVPRALADRAGQKQPGVYVASCGRRIYLLVCAGEKRTAGYELHPEGLLAEDLAAGRLRVRLVGPPPDAMVAQVLTYPFLVLDVGGGPVRLREAVLVDPSGEQPLPIRLLGEIPSTGNPAR